MRRLPALLSSLLDVRQALHPPQSRTGAHPPNNLNTPKHLNNYFKPFKRQADRTFGARSLPTVGPHECPALTLPAKTTPLRAGRSSVQTPAESPDEVPRTQLTF